MPTSRLKSLLPLSCLLLVLGGCRREQPAAVEDLFFSPPKMRQLDQFQRRSLIELAIKEQALDPLALASQLNLYLAWEDEPLQRAKHLLLMAERLLQANINFPTVFLLEQVLAEHLNSTAVSVSSALYPQAETYLLDLTSSPFRKSTLLKDLIAYDSADRQTRARWYFSLGENLEKIERWDEAMIAYQNFADFPDVSIPHLANAHSSVKNKLSIYRSKRKWVTDDNLDELVQDIRYIVQNRLIYRIEEFMANDFFAISGNFTNDSLRRGNIQLAKFLSPRVRFGQFTAESNNQEAWLETFDWSFGISRWYLYFRRIDYPANPDLDGRWEWAGIFIGNLL